MGEPSDLPDDPMVFSRVGRLRSAPRATSWWGRAWVRTFEELAYDVDDLRDARALARSGRLGAVMVLAGMASAVVDPGADEAVVAQVRVATLSDQEWQVFVDELQREAGFPAAVASGVLPTELVEAADARGVEIVPGPADLDTACECDGWAQPCRHALALLYQLAWHLDADPAALLLLRGRAASAVLAVDVATTGRAAEVADVARRAAEISRLAASAPTGRGLADAAVAAYDEAISDLL